MISKTLGGFVTDRKDQFFFFSFFFHTYNLLGNALIRQYYVLCNQKILKFVLTLEKSDLITEKKEYQAEDKITKNVGILSSFVLTQK